MQTKNNGVFEGFNILNANSTGTPKRKINSNKENEKSSYTGRKDQWFLTGRRVSGAIILLFLSSFASITAQSPYLWIGADGGSLTDASNWKPSRNTMANTDVLVFKTGTSLNLTAGNSNETIDSLIISNNTDVTLISTGGRTLTVNSALNIENGSSLTTGSRLTITLASGSVSGIAGSLNIPSGRTLNILSGATTNITGSVTVGGTISNSGDLSNSGTLTVNGGGTINNSGSIENTSSGLISNAGNFANNSASATETIGGNFTNTGNIDFSTGTNAITGTVTNNASFDISGGTTTVTGTIVNSSSVTGTTASSLIFSAGGTYQHAMNGGSIPTASWDPASTCNITGVTNTIPDNTTFAQAFGNFTWNCTSQNTDISFAANLSTVNGDLNILSTGSGSLRLMNGGGSGTYTCNVAGGFNQTGGTFYVLGDYYYSGVMELHVNGNFVLSGGSFSLSNNNQYGSMGTLYVSGDMTLASGTTFTKTSYGSGNVYFNGTAKQVYSSSATVSGTINYTVNSGAYLQMGTGAAPSYFTGGGTFTLSSGATLGITDINGITTGTTQSGNIKVTGTRTYSAGASYIYNGTAAQVTGNGLMQNNSPVNLTIDNPAGVSLTGTVTITGRLTMLSGSLNLSTFNITAGSLTGSSNISTLSSGATPLITIGSDGTSPDAYSGLISDGNGKIALTKVGAGVLTLSNAALSYTGNTSVNAGELRLNPVSTSASFASPVILSGGKLGTTSIVSGATINFASVLRMTTGSSVSLGSNPHSLIFPNSSGASWTGTLTIYGWGVNGGRLFFGTTGSGLNATQLGNITFDGYSAGATITSDGEVTPAGKATVTIATITPVVASYVDQGSKNNLVFNFRVSATGYKAVVSGLQIHLAGNFVQGDIESIKVWYSTNSAFDASSDVLISTIAYPAGAGTYIFPNWINQSINVNKSGNFFITADIGCSGTVGKYFNVNPVTTTDISIYATISGSTSAGGTKTIQFVAPTPVTTGSATSDNQQSTLTWSDPVACYDEIMIVAKSNSPASGTPLGNGTAYTASLVYGAGTSFGGGYVVYKGSSSPETVTGLINGVTYYFTFYTRKGTTWTTDLVCNATPVSPVRGDYKTAQSGTWSTPGTWLYYDGTTWATPTWRQGVPNNGSNSVTILSGHTVSVANWSQQSIDQLTVNAGGEILIPSYSTLQIYDDTGTDVTINGTLDNAGSVTFRNGATLAFGSGSLYIHDQDGGTIPAATWDPTSTCDVTGVISTSPALKSGQAFGNFTWDGTGQINNINLAGVLTTVNGDLTINDTNKGSLSLGDNNSGNLSIAGNYIQNGGTFYVTGTSTNAAARTMTVGGSFKLTSGTLNLTTNKSTTINVAGDFTHTGGTITIPFSWLTSSIVFNGNGIRQMYKSGGAVIGTVNFSVLSPAYLQMGTGDNISTITGGGKFTIASGATLGVTSPDGISTSGTSGNIQSTTRAYTAGANYIYNGSVNQVTGTGLSSAVAGNVTIDNIGGTGSNVVSLTAAKAISGNITVNNGVFDLGSNTIDRSTTGGTVTLAAGTALRIGGVNAFPANYTTKTLASASTVEYYGSNQGVTSIASPGYGNLIMSTGGTKTASGSIYVQSTTTLNSGITFVAGSYGHYLSGDLLNYGATFTGGTSTVTFNGADQIIGGTASTTFNNLTISCTDTVKLNVNASAAGNLAVTSGAFDLGSYTCNRASAGGTLSVSDGAALKIGGTNSLPLNYNTHTLGTASTVWYCGAAQTIYPEKTPGYGNLTLSGTGTKTIASGSAVTVNAALNTGNLLVVESTSLTSSGSLIVKGTSVGTLTYNRKLRPEDSYGSHQLVSSPVNSPVAPSSGKISVIYGYNEVSGIWTPTGTALQSGRGYNLHQTAGSDGLIQFTGTVKSSASIPATSPYADTVYGGETTYSGRSYIGATGHSGVARSQTNYGGGGWNLMGNPFTSAFNVASFLDANSSQFDPNYLAVYLYDPSAGLYYYISYPTGWGPGLSQTDVQAGQGFFVMAMNDLSTFSFDGSMQEHAPADAVFKSTKDAGSRWPGLQLKACQNTSISTTTVLFNSNMTLGVDKGYDVGLMSSYKPVELYTVLPSGQGTSYMQQALPADNIDSLVVPVGINSAAGGEVTFSAETEPLPGYSFLLEDKLTGTITDLSTASYVATIPAKTYGTGRFFLITKTDTKTDVSPEPDDQGSGSLKVWASGTVIYVSGEVNEGTIARVYDLQGRIVSETTLNEGSYNEVNVPEAKNGIYIVSIKDNSKIINKKVALN